MSINNWQQRCGNLMQQKTHQKCCFQVKQLSSSMTSNPVRLLVALISSLVLAAVVMMVRFPQLLRKAENNIKMGKLKDLENVSNVSWSNLSCRSTWRRNDEPLAERTFGRVCGRGLCQSSAGDETDQGRLTVPAFWCRWCRWRNWWNSWHMFYVPMTIGNVIIPIDELIFFTGVAQPPTSWLVGCRAKQCELLRDVTRFDPWWHPRVHLRQYGGFLKWGYPKMVGL